MSTYTSFPITGIPLSGLNPEVTPALSDILASVQSGVTYSLTLAQIQSLLISNNSSFIATTAGHNNVLGNAANYSPIFETTTENIGMNYNTSTGTYTAPVNGWYVFNTCIEIGNLSSGHTNAYYYFSTSAGQFLIAYFNPYAFKYGDNLIAAISGSITIYLTAGQTCGLQLNVGNSTQTVSLANNSYFMGRQIG